MVDQYIFSGSLPENASTYVIREADSQLYEGLKAGKFCYVLNSRQSGKSSLRVRTMQRLRDDGVQCAAVDLSAGGIQNVPPEQWYADLIDTLIDSFGLDLDFGDWWEANQLNSLVTRFRKFLEEVLLVEVQESIVIFIDEIDSVLSLNFPADDFFALIRACYNKRVDNPQYNRLTFCLLGVASPTSLIQDKQCTPFNIGQAISLKGFQLHEVKPLEKGLYGKFSNPQAIIQEILQWTGGQPFLTQKLCKIFLEYVDTKNFPSPENIELISVAHPQSLIPELVRWFIIENWESQDEPEHLRTIRDRLLYNGLSMSKLLGLYQQILQKGEILIDNSYEQTQLQLSGLVVKQQGSLRVYNRIYELVFDSVWVGKALADLRPYSEAITAWLNSNYQDESRLLRGQALQDAQIWAADKNLSDADYHFLNASLDFDRREAQTALAAEKEASQILTKANQKAKRTIKRGVAGFILISVGAVSVITWASTNLQKAQKDLKETQTVTRIEREGKNVGQQFKFSQLDTLVSTMRAAQELKDIVSDGRPLENYPTTTPILSLQTILDRIQEKNRIEDENGNFQDAQFSPDGKLLATAGGDNKVILRNLQGQQIVTFSADHKIEYLQFSPDSKLLATVGDYRYDGKIRLWNLQGQKVAEFSLNGRSFSSLSFSPDQKLLAITDYDNNFGSSKNKMRLWNIQRQQVASFPVTNVNNVSFSPDGKLLAIVEGEAYNNTRRVRLSDLQGKQVATFSTGDVEEVNFSPDSKLLAIEEREDSLKRKVRLWNLQGKHGDDFKSLRFSHNGKFLATISADNKVNLYSSKNQLIASFQTDEVDEIKFSPDSNNLAILKKYGYSQKLQLWNIPKQQITTLPASNPFRIFFSDDSKFLAVHEGITATADDARNGKLRLWNFEGQEIIEIPAVPNIKDIKISPDGKQLTVVKDNKIYLWNLYKQQIAKFPSSIIEHLTFSDDGKLFTTKEGLNIRGVMGDWQIKVRSIQGQKINTFTTRNFNDIIFSFNRKVLATVEGHLDKNIIRLWNFQGKQITAFSTNYIAPTVFTYSSVRFSADGKRLATIEGGFSTDRNRKVRVWNLQGQQIAEFPAAKIEDVILSPDGESIAIIEGQAINYGKVQIRNLQGQQLGTFPAFISSLVSSPSSSPDGKLLAIGYKSEVRLWSFAEKRIVATIIPEAMLSRIGFTPDSKLLATLETHKDRQIVRYWNTQGQQLASFATTGYVNDIKFSPDGKLLATLESRGYNAKVRLWNLQGKQVAEFPSGDSEVKNIKFSPNSKLLAAIEADENQTKVRLWNIQGQQVGEFISADGNIKNINSINFSPDGKLLVIQGEGQGWLWHVKDLDELLTEGCDYLKDYLANHPKTLKELHVCQTKLGISPTIYLPDFEPFQEWWIKLPITWNFWTFYWLFWLPSWLLSCRADIVCFPGYILRLFKRHEKEILFYEKIVKLTPKWCRVWQIQGQALSNLNRHEEAIASYNKALEINPKDYWSWNNRGWELQKIERNEEAIANYKKAIQLDPNQETAWSNLEATLKNLNRSNELISYYDEWLERKPKKALLWKKRGWLLAEKQQHYEDALVSFDRAIKLKHNYYDAWNGRGWTLYKVQHYEEAIAAYDQAIKINPDYYLAWHNRAFSLAALQRYEDAIYSYDEALKLDPNHYFALYGWYEKGVALTYLERYEEAISSFEQLIEIISDNLKDDNGAKRVLNFEVSCFQHLMIYLGTAYALHGNIEAAQKQWQKGLEVYQEDEPCLKLSRILYKIAVGETEEAITKIKTMLEEDIALEILQDALKDAEVLARCPIEGINQVVQLLKQRLGVATSQN